MCLLQTLVLVLVVPLVPLVLFGRRERCAHVPLASAYEDGGRNGGAGGRVLLCESAVVTRSAEEKDGRL